MAKPDDDSTAPLKGLDVLVIGAGFGGLASAIALRKQGASVKVLELSPDMKRQGDVIMMGPNATMIIKKWGNCLPELMKGAAQPKHMVISKKNGTVLLDSEPMQQFDGNPSCYTGRGRTQEILYEYAVSLGVHVIFGARVINIFEQEDTARVVTEDQTYEGHLVVAGDGVHSKARNFVLGVTDRPRKSGFAVYRSWFPFEVLERNSNTKHLTEGEAIFQMWIAEDKHAILTTNPNLRRATCFVTHKDTADIKEDWNLPGDPEDMLKIVEDWDPLLVEVVKQVPKDCLIDYKLLWRDPVRKWASDGGRLVLVGDAAHPHLATSGTGGAQAIEDGATLAVLLAKLGKDRIPLALRAFERLRYERTSLTQRMGFETRHIWHQTDWDAVANNPEILKFPQPVWLNGIDAEEYALQNVDAVVAHLETGTPFTSTNVPDGYVHEDWTIDEMLSFEGKKAASGFYKVASKN